MSAAGSTLSCDSGELCEGKSKQHVHKRCLVVGKSEHVHMLAKGNSSSGALPPNRNALVVILVFFLQHNLKHCNK